MKDLWFFLRLFKPYWLWLVTGLFLALLTTLASISLLTLSGWFITSAAVAGLLAPDGVAVTFNFMQPAAEIRALAIIRTFGRYAERVVTHEATFRVLAEIRCWFFAKLIPLSPGQLSSHRSADLLNGITQDIDTLDALYLRLCSPLLIALVGGGMVVVFISYFSVSISFFVSIILLVSIVLIPLIFYRLGRHGAEKIVEDNADFKIKQIELLEGIAELTLFNAYTRYKNKLISVSEKLIETGRQNNQLSALSAAIISFIAQLTLLLTIVFAARLFQQDMITGAELVMISFCVWAVFELVTPLAPALQMLAKTRTAAKRIRRIAEQPPAILKIIHTEENLNAGDIKISQLSFRYSSQSEWVLNNISLSIPQGSKIAIVGDSGAGKSTLLQLILRFFDPQQGRIEYAGSNYKQLDSHQLMAQFSVLSQQTQLFSTTIKNNLLIAKPSASDKEIVQAIKMAGLEQYIRQLPGGIKTWIGKNGSKVSTGEARRIALARVYLKNAPVLLLDEPTEGLDLETENEVLTALEKIAEQKTLIMVTHKQAALRLVDKVYTMQSLNGKL